MSSVPIRRGSPFRRSEAEGKTRQTGWCRLRAQRRVLTSTGATTGPASVRSMRYRTVTCEEGQQSGSELAYREKSAVRLCGCTRTAPDELSSRDVMEAGD